MKLTVKRALIGGFSLLLALFLCATALTVRSVQQFRRIDARLANLDHAKHQGHLAVSDIKELYIHQAHTLILRDRSHLEHYKEHFQAWLSRRNAIDAACEQVGVKTGVAEVLGAVDEMHRYFDRILPHIVGSVEPQASRANHAALDQLKVRAVTKAQEFNSTLEHESARTRLHLETVAARTEAATVIMFTLALLATAAMGLLLVRLIGRPLARLHEGFVRVRSGTLQTSVSPEGPMEVKELGVAFNDMSKALVEMQGEVRQKERLAVIGEIAAGVAHELNNPLAVITGYLKITQTTQSIAQIRRDLQIVEDETRQCRTIVQELLELGRPPATHPRRIDLIPLIQETVQRLEAVHPDSSVSIQMSTSCPRATVLADPSSMRRVLTNILGNALDAVGTNGRVQVVVAQVRKKVEVAISDSGPGIDGDMREAVFRPFMTTKENGTGLGLAISEAVIRALDGRIMLDCGPLGGARFRILIPVADAFKPPRQNG